MRRVILSLVAALLTTLSLPILAQKSNPGGPGPQENATLEGIWQLCKFQKSDSGSYEVHLMPVIKVITKDGAYHDIFIRTVGGISGIAEQGTLKKENDTTLVLIPEVGPRAEGSVALEKKLTFHLQGLQWMVIDFKAADTEKENHEIWMRLRMLREGQSLIEQILKGDMSPSEEQGPMHGLNGNQNGNVGRQHQRQNGNRRIPGNNTNSQNQVTSPIDNSWMNEN